MAVQDSACGQLYIRVHWQCLNTHMKEKRMVRYEQYTFVRFQAHVLVSE